jgi:hypothetical protein
VRNRLGELAILLGASLVCVVGVELACRVFLPQWKPPDTADGLFRYDARLGWVHEPGRVRKFAILETTTTVSINSHGLRDREYALARSGDARRMLVLGDSMAWGWGVEADQIFCERLEARHPDWEIIDAAVPGYSTDQQLLYFEREGRRWNPDVVLLLFHPNDAEENERTAQSWQNKPGFELVAGELVAIHQPVPERSFAQALASYVHANTYFWSRVQGRLRHWLRPAATPAARGRLAPDGPEVEYPLTMELLLALGERVERAGSRLLVVGVPMLGEKEQKIERAVAETLRYAGVPFQPLSASFADRFDALMFEWNGHWNPQGHAVAADAVERFLSEQGVFGPAGGDGRR